MAQRIKHIHLAREHYDDLDVAIKELGSLWILDRINAGLTYGKKRAKEMHDKRHPQTGNSAHEGEKKS